MSAAVAVPGLTSERTETALGFLQRLLTDQGLAEAGLPELLAHIAVAFAARRAGLIQGRANQRTLESAPTAIAEPVELPWIQQPQLLTSIRSVPEAQEHAGAGRYFVLAALQPAAVDGAILWIEVARSASTGERSALALVAQTLQRFQAASLRSPRWALQLRRAQLEQDLEKASAVVRRLAHDYGNVLTSIMGFSELGLGQNPRDAALLRYLQEVHRGAEQGAQLTNRLRMFSRRIPLATVRPINLAAALRDEQQRLGSNWPARIRLELDLATDLPPVAVSLDALREILACLLDNAKEAIPGEGCIRLRASAQTLDTDTTFDILGHLPAGPCVEISVEDNGTGLTPEVSERLFHELFYTSKPRHRGLGLFVAYGLIASHRGGLRLTSEPTGGTAARVYFPFAQTPALEPTPPPREPQPRRERILVVDDDPLVLKMVCTTLQRNGYAVASALSAREAMTAYRGAREQPFHLVISDVVMPQTNGVDLARELLACDSNQRLLFMSGHVSTDFMHHSLAQRSVELLAKPFRPEGLLRAVRQALDRPLPSSAVRTVLGDAPLQPSTK